MTKANNQQVRTLPNTLHIGYSKSASTWLQGILKKNKDIFYVYKTYYFFPLDSDVYKKGLDHYSEFFKDAQDEKIIIESQEHIILPEIHPELKCASTNLTAVEENLLRIKKDLPDIKIIVVIRNQIDMLLSRYTQYILQGGKLKASAFLKKLVFDNNAYEQYVDYRYSKVMDLLHNIFSKDRVLILFQEELRANPQDFLSSLSEFLGVPLTIPPSTTKKKSNPAPSLKGTHLLRRVNKLLVKEIETIEQRTQTRGPYFLWYFITRAVRLLDHLLVKKKQKKKLFSPQEYSGIRKIYAEDNKELIARFKEKNLAKHGYHSE